MVGEHIEFLKESLQDCVFVPMGQYHGSIVKRVIKTSLSTGQTCSAMLDSISQTPLAGCATNVCELGKGTNRQSDAHLQR